MQRRVVTVFGGSGFLGRHLVKRLAAQDAIVRVAVRDPEGALFLKPLGDVGQIVPWAADVTDTESVALAVDGADSVVNLVGILFEKGKRTFARVHAEGAANVAAAATAAGVKRLVQVSAIGADPESPSAYARTKAAGEAAVRKAFPDATVVRPSVVFGPEDGFFNMFAGIARISPMLPVFGCPLWPRITFGGEGFPIKVDLYGDGGTKFQPVYVGDVADALVAILNDPKTKERTYELGGPRVYSFKAIMELLLKEIGRRRLIVPIPFAIGMIQGFFLQMLPRPPLTCDQVTLLKRDNVVAPGALTFKDLGISPTTAEMILPTYLKRFRRPAKAATMLPT
jgi:NADH dehydrogenase